MQNNGIRMMFFAFFSNARIYIELAFVNIKIPNVSKLQLIIFETCINQFSSLSKASISSNSLPMLSIKYILYKAGPHLFFACGASLR